MRPTAEEFRRELRILTHEEEQRARRLALARWLAPTALAILTLFATTAMVLTREAELQRVEARHERVRASQAQARATSMRTNLEEEKGRRRVVENEFRNSRVTCGELEQRLIRAEQELVRQQQAAEETAGEICRLRKGTDCKPPSTDLIPGDPANPIVGDPANPVAGDPANEPPPDPANPVPDPANPAAPEPPTPAGPAPVSSVNPVPAQ